MQSNLESDDKYQQYIHSPQWAQKVKQRMEIDNYQCQCCGSRGTTEIPLECHHLTYDRIYHEDVYTDLETLCRACHKGIHRAQERITNQYGRRGWKNNPRIPKIHIFSITGNDRNYKESDI